MGQLLRAEDSLEPRNVMQSCKGWGDREEIEDVDLHSGKSPMTSMHSLNIRFAWR